MDLIEQYRMMHEAGHFPGHSLKKHLENIEYLIRKTGSKTVLDYGCGKALAYVDGVHRPWDIKISLYDPAVPKFSEKPVGKFDGVICTDVLEHIPEEDVAGVLREIFSYSNKFVFLSICTRKAKKTLPDGRNCHLTVRSEQWWLSTIEGLEPSVLWEVAWNE